MYISDIPDYFYRLCPAHQADFVRVHVVCDYGGIWLDSDTLVMHSLDSLFAILDSKDGFFIRENNEILWNGVFGSRPNTELMTQWKQRLRHILDEKKEAIAWSEVGCQMLQGMYNETSALYDSYELFNGLDTMYPVNWNHCVNSFLHQPYETYPCLVRDFQPVIVLVHSVYQAVEHMSIQDILGGNTPMNYFINKSFENAGISRTKLFTQQPIVTYTSSDFISSSIHACHCWEPTITNVFVHLLKKNKQQRNKQTTKKQPTTVIDIGCNFGYFSLVASSWLTADDKIVSVDANAVNLHLLQMSCDMNDGLPHILPCHVCISDKTGDLYAPGNKELVERVGNIGGMSYQKQETQTAGSVRSTTLDDLVASHNITDVLLLKIDIEGGEWNALRGATRILNNVKNIIIEISPVFNQDSENILNLLRDNDYELFDIPLQECGPFFQDDDYVTHKPINDISDFVKSIPVQTNIWARKKPKYVVITDWIQTYVTMEPFHFVQHLETLGWEIMLLSQINVDTLQQQPDTTVLCVTYDDLDIGRIKHKNVFLIYKMDDLYPFKEVRRICTQQADLVIGPYQYLFHTDEKVKRMYPNLNLVMSYQVFYSAVPAFFSSIPFSTTPKQKVLVTGALGHEYPLRLWIHSDETFAPYVERYNHPGYGSHSEDVN